MKKLSVLFFAVVCALACSVQCPRASQPTARQIRNVSKALDAKIKKESSRKLSDAKEKVKQLTKKMGESHPETRQAKEALVRADASHAGLSASAPQGYSVSSTRKQRDALRAKMLNRSNSDPSISTSEFGLPTPIRRANSF